MTVGRKATGGTEEWILRAPYHDWQGVFEIGVQDIEGQALVPMSQAFSGHGDCYI